MSLSKLDLIISQIVELSLEEKSNDPVRNLYSVCINISNKIDSIMCKLREQERYAKINQKITTLDRRIYALH